MGATAAHAPLLPPRRYGLGLETLDIADFKAGLEAYLARTGVRAIVLGTRK